MRKCSKLSTTNMVSTKWRKSSPTIDIQFDELKIRFIQTTIPCQTVDDHFVFFGSVCCSVYEREYIVLLEWDDVDKKTKVQTQYFCAHSRIFTEGIIKIWSVSMVWLPSDTDCRCLDFSVAVICWSNHLVNVDFDRRWTYFCHLCLCSHHRRHYHLFRPRENDIFW